MALETRKKTVGIVDPDMAATMGYIATIANLEDDFEKAMFFSRQVGSCLWSIGWRPGAT